MYELHVSKLKAKKVFDFDNDWFFGLTKFLWCSTMLDVFDIKFPTDPGQRKTHPFRASAIWRRESPLKTKAPGWRNMVYSSFFLWKDSSWKLKHAPFFRSESALGNGIENVQYRAVSKRFCHSTNASNWPKKRQLLKSSKQFDFI